MTLLAPQWLWGMVFLGLAVILLHRSGRIQWRAKAVFLAASTVCAMAALSRPAVALAPVELLQRGNDVVFVVDISGSMQAADLTPSRLGAARRLLESVVKHDDVNRYAVVAFTTNPIILSPLTRDDELLLHLFSGLDTSMVLTKGTDIGKALKLARKLSQTAHPVIVLMTDGGDALDYTAQARWAKENGMVVHVVMLGTVSGITLKTQQGKWLRDNDGSIVVVARNDAVEAISEATGGALIEGPDAAELLSVIHAQDTRGHATKRKVIRYRELFVYPLAFALLLAMLGMTDLYTRWSSRA